MIYRTLRYIEKKATVPLIGICVWEAVALTFPNPYTPPITKVLNKNKWVFPLFCGLLGVHIWCYEVAGD